MSSPTDIEVTQVFRSRSKRREGSKVEVELEEGCSFLVRINPLFISILAAGGSSAEGVYCGRVIIKTVA